MEEGEEKMVIYQLLEDRVCRFFAELLLRPAGRVGKLETNINILIPPPHPPFPPPSSSTIMSSWSRGSSLFLLA